jgi:protein-disulfide isomerase
LSSGAWNIADFLKVKLIFADFPVVQIHPEAILAAMAVDCAGDQHKYWQYHDKVFREQGRDDEVFRFATRDLKKWARNIDLEASAFNQCLDSGRHKDDVARTKRLVISWASGARRRFSSTTGVPSPARSRTRSSRKRSTRN